MPEIELLGIPIPASGHLDIYSGVQRMSGRTWASLHTAGAEKSTTVVVIAHPASNFLGHYLLEPLAARGVDVAGLTTRYVGNDSTLIMENCVLDIGAAISILRDRGYEKVILLGNSGGGGLVAFYQSQAERPTVTGTPAGDPPDLTAANLPPADGLIALMAHPGRARVLAEWIDPAIVDEGKPFQRDRELDLVLGRITPPYSPEFLQDYRSAQRKRIRRITSWVREELQRLEDDPKGPSDLPFVVHGTIADPRFLDLTIDPSDRLPGTMWGPVAEANFAPAALGRFSSLRSWLSQWSIDDSNADGVTHIARTSVPTLVMYGTADQICFPSYAHELFDAVGHEDRTMVAVPGGTHYLQGQTRQVADVANTIVDWIKKSGSR